jgi:signal peptidase I
MVDLADKHTKSITWQIIAPIVIVLFVFFWLQASFQSFVVEGVSMEPGLHGGQVLLINKAAYWFGSPHRGDVIVFRAPQDHDRVFVKRVIGLPGEEVKIENGKVYIDGEPLPEPDFIVEDHSDYSPVNVTSGHYFVLGDNRDQSSDSRQWGMVPEGDIIGKAWLSVWPLSDWGLAPNYALKVE